MRAFLEDLYQAYRSQRAGLAITSILTVAVATGATIAIFSIFYAVLVRPLPYAEPESLYVIWEDATLYGFPQNSPAPANYMDWKRQSKSFSAMSAYSTERFVLTGEGDPVILQAASASADIFALLGPGRAEVGRLPSQADDQAGAAKICVLTHRLWQKQFSGDPGIVGKAIRLDGNAVEVAGVLPENFVFPFEEVELMVPFAWNLETQNDRENHYLLVLGRLRNQVHPDRALEELKVIAKRLESTYPETNKQLGVQMVDLRRQLTGDFRTGLLVLFAAVAFVLLIACANLAGLQLSHAMDRIKEMSLRAALGASPFRIGRMLLCESLILAIAGGAAGLLLSTWIARAITGLLPADVMNAAPVRVDGYVILFSLILALLAGILSGIVPALQIVRKGLSQTMKEGSSRLIGGRNRMRSAFVIGQVALCVCLVIAAGLMLRSLQQVMSVSLGFNPDNVLTLRTTLSPDPYQDFDKRLQFFSQVLRNVRSLQGVTGAGYTSHLPLTWSGDNNQFNVEGVPVPPGGSENLASLRVISPDYFRALGATMIQGRDFNDDDKLDSPRVAIINQTLARQFWPDGDAVNKRIQRGRDVTPDGWLSIVGVVPDLHQSSLETVPRPEIYLPYTQRKGFYFVPQDLVVRIMGEPTRYAGDIRRIIVQTDRNQPVSNVMLLQDLVRNTSAGRITQSALFTVFGLIALLLASLGIYGIMTHMVVRRTPEIGIRMILGARTSQLVRLILLPALGMTAAGTALGLAASFALARLLQSLLFGISPTDTLTFLAVPFLLVAISCAACLLPVRRVTKIDPAAALRNE